MVNEFCGFKHGVIGTDKIPADTTLNNMKKADLIKLLHTAQHNYETLMWFYNNAVKANMSQLNNNGWIPVSSGKLPDDGVPVEVTIREDNDNGGYDLYVFESWYQEGRWAIDKNRYNPTVIAWKPKDAPYQPKGE